MGARERDANPRSAFSQVRQTLPAARVIVVDESSTHYDMYPTYACAPKGRRAVATAHRNYGSNVSLITSLSLRGSGPALAVEGAVTTAVFSLFIRECLVPTLQSGDIVLMDNLPCHKATAVQAAIEAAGVRLLFLPAYSPDFSPIEHAFSKVKTILRRLRPQVFDELVTALHPALDAISPSDALGYFRATGFLSQNSSSH